MTSVPQSVSGQPKLNKWFAIVGVTASLWFLRLSSGFALYDTLLILVFTGLVISKRRIQFPEPFLNFSGYLIILLGLLSTFRSPDPMQSINTILQLVFIFGLLLPLTYSLVDSARDLEWHLIAIFLGTVIVAAYGLYEIVIIPRPYVNYRYAGPFEGSPGSYAAVLVVGTVLAFWLWDWAVGKKHASLWRIGLLLFLASAIAGILLSNSRSGIVALTVIIVAYISLRSVVKVQGRGKGLRVLVWVVLVLFLLGGAGKVYWDNYMHTSLKSRLLEVWYLEEKGVGTRLESYRATVNSISDTVILGFGFDNSIYFLNDYQTQFRPLSKPHNFFFTYWFQSGLISAFLVVGLFAVFLYRTARVFLDPGTPESLARMVLALFVIQLGIIAIFLFTPSPIRRFYFVLYGLGVVAVQIVERQTVPSSRFQLAPPTRHRDGVLREE